MARMESVRMRMLATKALTVELLSELWDFTTRFVETDRQTWEGKLAAHAEVIVYRGRNSGEVVGMAAVDFLEVTHEGRRAHIIFTSSVLLDERYRGKNLLQRAGLSAFCARGSGTRWPPSTGSSTRSATRATCCSRTTSPSSGRGPTSRYRTGSGD